LVSAAAGSGILQRIQIGGYGGEVSADLVRPHQGGARDGAPDVRQQVERRQRGSEARVIVLLAALRHAREVFPVAVLEARIPVDEEREVASRFRVILDLVDLAVRGRE